MEVRGKGVQVRRNSHPRQVWEAEQTETKSVWLEESGQGQMPGEEVVAVGKAAGWGYRHRPTVPLEDGNGTEIQTGASRLTVFRVLRHLCCAGPSSMWAHQGSYRRTLPLWALATLCSHSGPTRTGLQRPKEPRGAEWLDGIKMESGLPFPLVTVTHTRVMNQPCQHRGRPQ